MFGVKSLYTIFTIGLFILGFTGQTQAQVSITSHGAVASASVDNLAAINRAIADARAKGTYVYVPAGTFGYSGVIRLDSVDLVGQGHSSVLHSLDPYNLAIFVYGSGVEIKNLKLAGAYAARRPNWEGTRITLFSATNFVIDNVFLEGSTGAGIQTAGGTGNGRISNSIIRNTQADSIHMTDGANYITVDNNLIENAGDDGVAVVSYQGNSSLCHHITARNNRILNNKHGRNMSVVGGRDIIYENNYMDGNPSYACLYISQESSWNTYGVYNMTAQYNTIKNCGSTTTGHAAVMIFSQEQQYVDGVNFVRNDIYQPSYLTAVRVFGTMVRNILLDSNRINGTASDYNIASSGVTLIRYSSGAVGYTDPSTQPPPPAPVYSLSISSPASGATVSGTVQIQGTAQGMQNVEIFNSSGALLAQATPSSTGAFSASLNTNLLVNGSQSLTIKAWDAPAGQPATQELVKYLTLNVQNGVTTTTTTTTTTSTTTTTVPAPTYNLTINSPGAGTTVSGIIQISGSAQGFANVEVFSSSGTMLARATLSGGSYLASVDTKSLANGSQTFTVRAWDSAAGQPYTQTASKSISLNVQNSVADTDVPSVSITNPAAESRFSPRSLISVSASASDNVGVVDVRFYLNGSLICTDTTAAYQCQMRLPKRRQSNTIEVQARDAAGNIGRHSIRIYTQ